MRGDHSWCDRRPPEDAVWRTGWRCGWRLLVPLPIGWDSSYWLVILGWTYFAATHWWVYVVMPWWSTEPLSVRAWSAYDAWELHALPGRVVTRVHMRNCTRVAVYTQMRVVTRGMRVLHVKCVGSTRMKFMTSSVSLHLQDYLMKTWKIPLSYSGKKKKRGNDKPLRDRKTQGWGDLKRCTNDKYVRLDFFGIPKLHIFCMAPKWYNQFFALSRKTLQECLRSR